MSNHKRPIEPTFRREKVTPNQASAWLKTSPYNRTVKARMLVGLERALRTGQWKFNGAPIVLDEDGRLTDGHHRCMAIVNTGVSVDCLIARGVPRDTETTMDVGSKRTIADILQFHGYKKNAPAIASTVNIIWRHITGNMYTKGRQMTYPTGQEVLDLLEACPAIPEAVGTSWKWRKVIPASVCGYMHYMCSEDASVTHTDFLDEVAGIQAAQNGSPAFALQRRLMEDKASNTKLSPEMRLAYTIKCYNFWRAGRDMGSLRIRRTGPNIEQWPMLDCPMPVELQAYATHLGYHHEQTEAE